MAVRRGSTARTSNRSVSVCARWASVARSDAVRVFWARNCCCSILRGDETRTSYRTKCRTRRRIFTRSIARKTIGSVRAILRSWTAFTMSCIRRHELLASFLKLLSAVQIASEIFCHSYGEGTSLGATSLFLAVTSHLTCILRSVCSAKYRLHDAIQEVTTLCGCRENCEIVRIGENALFDDLSGCRC